MTTVNLQIDDGTKEELEEMCFEMGINLDSFFMIYVKKALRERKIPFEITASEGNDPFYSEVNLKRLEKAEQQVKAGKVVIKSLDELKMLENG